MGLRECFTPQKKKVKGGLFIGRIRWRPSSDKDYGGDSSFDCKPSDYAQLHERVVYL
jgi:hypothetical protein